MKAAASGRPVVANQVYKVTRPIIFDQPGAHITGKGTLIAGGELAGKDLLHLRSPNCLVKGLTFKNPSEVQTKEGAISSAIRISADGCLVSWNHVDRFQNGIVVSADGEFYDNRIENNRVTNVLGAGDGRADLKSSFGEDRGDGIVSWGARTRILNNFVAAKPGTDARVGIHVEALPDYIRRPRRIADDSGAEIVGNRVEGPFRRGIVNEGVANVMIRRNELSGDFAWWGIAVVGGASATNVVENTLHFDRTISNLSGAAWGFWPAAIQVAGFGSAVPRDIRIVANTIVVGHSGGAAIQYQNVGGRSEFFVPLIVRQNKIVASQPNTYHVKVMVGSTTMNWAHNEIIGKWPE